MAGNLKKIVTMKINAVRTFIPNISNFTCNDDEGNCLFKVSSWYLPKNRIF